MLPDGIAERIDAHEYPATTEELIDAHGDRVLDFPAGSETVGDALSRIGPERLETPEDVRLTLYSAVSDDAVGRVGYSDRDPTPPGVDGRDPVSF